MAAGCLCLAEKSTTGEMHMAVAGVASEDSMQSEVRNAMHLRVSQLDSSDQHPDDIDVSQLSDDARLQFTPYLLFLPPYIIMQKLGAQVLSLLLTRAMQTAGQNA